VLPFSRTSTGWRNEQSFSAKKRKCKTLHVYLRRDNPLVQAGADNLISCFGKNYFEGPGGGHHIRNEPAMHCNCNMNFCISDSIQLYFLGTISVEVVTMDNSMYFFHCTFHFTTSM